LLRLKKMPSGVFLVQPFSKRLCVFGPTFF
jgi:hypothetical protein